MIERMVRSKMKKYLCAVFAIVMLMISISGCASAPEVTDPVVLPPTRIGASGCKVIRVKDYTFKSAWEEADVVARVEVGNWIAEDTEIIKTYYEAKVLQCFKGSIPENITLYQEGCSAFTMKGYPLFTSGNEFLVFLMEATATTCYEAPFWIMGSFTTILDVSYDENGNRYYADSRGFLGKSIDIAFNYAYDTAVSAEVMATAVAKDPIVSERLLPYHYIFSEEDFLALAESQQEV